jgi:hypothetical protein
LGYFRFFYSKNLFTLHIFKKVLMTPLSFKPIVSYLMKLLLNMRLFKSFCMLNVFLVPFYSFCQNNSPWKNLSSQTTNGIYIGIGRHEYSLSSGQGFSVYLKNTGKETVTVTGTLVAKTVCGNEVTTDFSTVLAQGQVASGGNFGSGNSQTGVVTEADCKGVKYAQTNFVNRIKEVTIVNLNVLSASAATHPSVASTPKILPSANDIKNVADATPIPTAPVPVKIITPIKPIIAENSRPAVLPVTEPKTEVLAEPEPQKKTAESTPAQPIIINTPTNWPNLFSDKPKKKKQRSLSPIAQQPNPTATTTTTPSSSNSVASTSLLNDMLQEKKSLPADKNISIDVQPGIGWDIFPIIINNQNIYASSETGTSSHPVLQLGGKSTILLGSKLLAEVDPALSYGLNLSAKGHHLVYGSNAALFGKLGSTMPLQLFGSIGYWLKNGKWEKADANYGQQQADYNYQLLKYGIGLRYTLNENFWVKPGIYWEKASFFASGTSPVMVGNVQALFQKKWLVEASYSKNYLIGGTTAFPNNFSANNQNFFSIRLLANIAVY